MRQEKHSSKQGNKARPLDRATLAGRLASIHPADVLQGATILGEFAGMEMRDASFTAGHGGTYSEAEELAATVMVVLRDSPEEFSGVLNEYIRLIAMVRAFLIRQGGNALAVAQLDKITAALAVDGDAAVIDPAPIRPGLRQLIRDKAVIAAVVLMAGFLWAITSDHCAIWNMLAAIALVLGVCGVAFRAGRNIQTPVAFSGRAGADTTADHTGARQS